MVQAARAHIINITGHALRFIAFSLLIGMGLMCFSPTSSLAQQLVINNVGAPTTSGTGQGKRALWTNAGTVGATTVDIVAIIETATLDHTPSTQTNRPSITSVGQDNIWVRWYLYQAGTYNLASNSGGVPVVADIHVQFNDVDGPNNERVFVPVCAGDVEWLRIDSNASTGVSFGTVDARPEIFSLIGDQNYNSQPQSGVEISYPKRSNFLMGRTADNGFFIRLDNPTYSEFDTYDYNCGDFSAPIANDDEKEGTPGQPTVLNILNNDANATTNDNPTNNGDLLPSEYGKISVELTTPAGATNIVLDSQGQVASFDVPDEGSWSYDESNGELSFMPLPSFKGYAATVDYTYTNALDVESNAATVTVWYPAIGAVKTATPNDENGDGFAQAGETITYQYALTAYGNSPLENVSLVETGFTGAGTLPVPVLQSGDTNSDSRLDLTETWIYSATYTLVEADLVAGSVSNQATASAETPGGTPVTDLSDSTNPSDGDGTGTPGPGPDNDDPTESTLGDTPIVAEDDSIAAPIDGSVSQTGVVDLLADNGNGPDTLDAIAATSGTVTAAAFGSVPSGFTINPDGTVDVTATIAPGPYSFDYQICETLNATNCATATVTLTIGSGGIGVIKSATLNDENGDGFAQTGESISYSYSVTNIGNMALSSITLTETGFAGAGTPPVPALQSGDTNSNSVLELSETWVYTAAYTLVAADLTAGSVSNQATATGETPGGTPVSDISDSTNPADGDGTGTPGSGPDNDDPTETIFGDAPIIAKDDIIIEPIDGSVSQTGVIDLLANNGNGPDTLDAVPATSAAVTATAFGSVPSGFTIDPDGTVDIAATIAPGPYSFDYQICETLNATNCATATVTLTIGSGGIGVVKSAALNDENSDGFAQTGESIAYTYSVTNTGNMALSSITLTETGFTGAGTPPVPALQGGDTNSNSILDLAETWTYTASYTLVAADLTAGSVSNQATATGSTPGRTPVSDLSDSTNPADGDGTATPGPGPDNDDPTTTLFGNAPIIASDDNPPTVISGTESPDIINVLGNDTLNGAQATAISVRMDVTTQAAAVSPGDAVPTLNPINANVSVSSAVPGGLYTITYRICEIGNVGNCDSAVVTVLVDAAIIAEGDTVSLSVDSAFPQPDVINVLTNDRIGVTPVTPAGVTLTVVGTLPAEVTLNSDGSVDIAEFAPSGSYTFDYQICDISNPANCDTATVVIPVSKSVPAISGTVYFDQDSNNTYNPGSDPAEPGYIVEMMLNGTVVKSTISASDGTYELRDFAPGSGYMLVFRDAATGMSVGRIEKLTFAPDTQFTEQNQPIDPRGVVYSSATGLPISGVGIRLTSIGGSPLPAACLLPGQQPQVTGADGAYRFDLVGGASVECPTTETEYRIEITGSPGHVPGPSLIAPPQSGALDATTCPGDAVPGGDCQLSASASAPPAGSPTPYYLAFLLQSGDPDVTNNHIPLDLLASITNTGLSVIKTAARPVVERGGLATYTIVIRNTNAFPVGPTDLVDRLPPGFSLIAGSATFEGAAAVPVISGREVRFQSLTLPASGFLTITLNSRVPARATPGDYVNEATLVDSITGSPLAPVGTATVRVDVDHVFDCGDVIGKVFDDRNRNGAQETGERGLPGVRLATVNGMLITTDKEGRYNVPCAALPDAARGSNFILKLDTRTLPTGYQLTTENPRVVRLTRGKATKLNFGVTIGQMVSVDLVGRAFYANSAQPLPAVDSVLAQIVGQLVERQGGLRLTYHINGDASLAESRLSSVEQIIRARWKQQSRTILSVERRLMEGN